MSIRDNHTDNAFRDKLQHFEIAPPPEVWDRVAGSLNGRKNRGRALLMWWSGAAAMLLLAFVGGWYLSENKQADTLLMTERDKDSSPYIQFNSSHKVNHTISVELAHPDINGFNEAVLAENRRLRLQSAQKVERETIYISKMQSHNELLKTDNEFVLALVENDNALSETDKAIVEANLLALADKNEGQKEGRWHVGVKGSPIYNFDAPSGFKDAVYTSQPNVVQNNVTTSYKPSFAGGMLFAYKASQRLKITSGVQYNEVAQGASGMAVSFAGQDWLFNSIETSYERTDAPKGSPDYDYQNVNNIVLNTQTGIANVALPGGVELSSVSKAENYADNGIENYDLKQLAAYVEVPLLMQYRLIDKRWGLYLNGGVNTNFLVNNSVQIKNNNEIVATGITEGLRNLAFSSSMGMGFDYMLSKHLMLNVEPTLKIYMNSLNDQSVFTAKPYTFGVFSGITYQF
ncbi:MAG TPA: outer membrane beta-barrel protein [Prolixibacteraceae bacterium]|nr:outer membrane beta-barrel protein [Prolixibacteraceae bacterium]